MADIKEDSNIFKEWLKEKGRKALKDEALQGSEYLSKLIL